MRDVSLINWSDRPFPQLCYKDIKVSCASFCTTAWMKWFVLETLVSVEWCHLKTPYKFGLGLAFTLRSCKLKKKSLGYLVSRFVLLIKRVKHKRCSLFSNRRFTPFTSHLRRSTAFFSQFILKYLILQIHRRPRSFLNQEIRRKVQAWRPSRRQLLPRTVRRLRAAVVQELGRLRSK